MRSLFKYCIIPLFIITALAVVVFKKWDLLFYGLIFLCPIMHLFGHHHHSEHNGDVKR